MAPIVPHHHRSTTHSAQKPYKSRHSSKNSLREKSKGRIEKGARRTPHQQVMSKLDRRNQAKQKRLLNHREHVKATSVFSGKDAAPRVVAVIPLCSDITTSDAVRKLNASLDQEVEVPTVGLATSEMERFKQRIQFIVTRRNLTDALDACRVADFILFVISAKEEVDELGELMLRSVESQGISTVFTMAQGLDSIEPPKKRPQVLSSLKSFITHFFPALEKVGSLDTRQDCLNMTRSLCTTTPKGINWREDRSWMLVEDVRWNSGKAPVTEEATGGLVLTGVVRGKSLKSDRLVHVGDWGDFQIEKIVATPIETKKRTRGDEMAVEDGGETILESPTEDQDDLNDLAPEEVVMEDFVDSAVSVAASERKGVLLDDHHYFDDEEKEAPAIPKRVPRGTSSYQAAWFLGDESDSGSDMEDMVEDDTMIPAPGSADGEFLNGNDDDMMDATEAGPSEYPQSEMFLDPSPQDEAEELEAYRKSRKNEAEEDLEFPDEIELHPNVLARERLARYRGLRSLRTSRWESEEDKPYQPTEWPRLLEIADYRAAKSKVLRETLVGGVSPGTRVEVHLRNVPFALQEQYDPARPLTLFSLLRHEHKQTAVNYSINLSSDVTRPLKSKEEIIAQCGPRRLVINPLYSELGATPNDVHKFHRYLHPGTTALASFIGPVTWGSVPILYFQRDSEGKMNLIGTGTSQAPSRNRVIAKRVILTGHPYKIHKKLVTVRYMFFNAEDVMWFKALKLWTKRGRSGFIKESLGTHGYFKATFDGRINPMDAVAVSLYKRVYPRSCQEFKGSLDDQEASGIPEVVMA